MKTLKYKTLDIKDGTGDSLTYGKLIEACLDHPPDKGFSRKDLKERDRIEQAVQCSNGELELEDADADILKRLVRVMRWGKRHRSILDFCDDVEAL